MARIAIAKIQSLSTAWQGEIRHGQHHYLTDKPESFGGQDAGPAPYDLLLAGLISCTMITLRMYAKHEQIELGEFEVEAEFFADQQGREWIERRLRFVKQHEVALQEKILEICAKTPVTKTLLRSLEIPTRFI
jgi:putative redox protein